MNHRSKRLGAAVLSAAILGGATARAEQPTTRPVEDEIKALRARLDQLEAQQKQDAQQRQQEIAERQREQEQKTATDVVRDADRHSALMDNVGFIAGYNTETNRFFLGSEDGNYILRPWYHLQVRNVTLWRQDQKSGMRDDFENGFEIRRMKIGLDGNMFSPDFTYFFNWATSRTTGTPILEEAWVKYNFHDTPWYIKGGQIKDPLLHDQVVSSRYQQSAERSLTADIFANGDAFTKGVTLIYDNKGWFRAEGGVNDGLRSANTNFQDAPTNPFDYGVAARAEFKLFGRWQDYGQVGAVGTKDPLLVIGVGADYSERGHAGQTVGLVDGMYADPGGLNIYGAAVDRYTNHNFGIATLSAVGASFISNPNPADLNAATNEYSLLLQAGYLFQQHYEPFARYEHFHLRGTPAGSRNDFDDITVGFNYYIIGHRAKLTAEIQYLPEGLPIDDSGSDVLASKPGKGEISGVVQFQLLL